MRNTTHRTEILSLLQNTHGVLSASNIHATLPHINLVTIYRTLDLFSSEGIVKKLRLNQTEATFEYQTHPHHHAICDECKRIIHITGKTEALKKQFTIPHFVIKNIEVIIHGTCAHTLHHNPTKH